MEPLVVESVQAAASAMPAVMKALGIAAVLAIGIFTFLAAAKSLLYICRPDQVLIISGRQRVQADGTEVGFRVIFGGRTWRVPIIEKVETMDLTLMEVSIRVRNAYSKGGIPLNLDAIANIKISSDPSIVGNAIERFLGRDRDEIRRVAKETLEGHLRGVLSTLTPEEVNEDRLKFAGELTQESEEDLNKLGIHLDTLKIQHVVDDVSYLDSIGRGAIANIVKNAEIAESDARRDAEQREATAAGRAKVTQANVEAKIAQMKNELRRVRAELEAQVNAEVERTKAAAREARAMAEQELQSIRAKLEAIRLKVEKVLPSEARRQAKEAQARGEAAEIRERGRAMGEVLELWNQAWISAGSDAIRIHLIQELEGMLTTVATGIQKVQIGYLSMIDGGDGKTLAAVAGAYPAMITSIFEAVNDTVGIDIPGIISGRDTQRSDNGKPKGLLPKGVR